MRILTVLALVASLGLGCRSGDGITPPVPAFLGGQYDVAITAGTPWCGFGAGTPGAAVMEVVEISSGSVEIDLVEAGACNPVAFGRDLNTLSYGGSEVVTADLGCGGLCEMQIDYTIELDFDRFGSFAGQEFSVLTALSGACGCAALPCDLTFGLSGTECAGCFTCPGASSESPSIAVRRVSAL